MRKSKRLIGHLAWLGLGIMAVLFPLAAQGADQATAAIGEAKVAIEQARQAGAEKSAPADMTQARSWLAQAEKEYESSRSVLSRTMQLVVSNEAKMQEIVYLADMARTKGRTAAAKAKRAEVAAELKDVRKDLADFQSSLEIMTKKLAEAEAAKAVKANAEAQLVGLAQAKQEVAQLEQQKKKELEEAQKKAAELDALRQKELQMARLQDAQEATEKERLALQKQKEAAEREAKQAEMEAMQKKMAAMEREKAMLDDAARIPQSSSRLAGGEMVVTIPVVNLFSPKNELHPQGKAILNSLADFLKKHAAERITVRSYTDSSGKAALNQSLSEQRARKVKEYLVMDRNLSAAQVTSEGLGASQPVANNATDAGRALNRRVEISLPVAP